MVSFLIRRIATAIVLAWVVLTLIFFAIHTVPGDPAYQLAGGDSGFTEEGLQQIRESLGLDRPLGEQYANYLLGVLGGDLGESFATGQPVAQSILRRLPATLQLIAAAAVLAIAAGIPYLLFLTRVRHPGMVALFGTVLALLFLMTGQPWQSTLVTIGLSLVAEVVLRAGGYRSKWAAIWTYVVFSAWFVGPWIPFFLDQEEYLRGRGVEAMGEAYLQSFAQVVTVPAVLIMVAATLVCGFLGALLGTALLRKHFQRAGLA